ncbi:G-protein coupled receptor-associated protein LMBRD2-like isoform X2 [Dreissena polymorpha]|uniref:G-protein coupled receptor-associated protein LMBRD2-like isoform X2 n=1 Tax=Dreissena polymorpha TaxID=45954 RepID=UPI0022653933|nr:G-protein coupled receptor-associated protein LMBRD2-like isoform X2 [Dreissena polymorpha]
MSAGPLVVEIICTCFLAAFLLHRYGDLRKQHVLVTLFTFIAWYFSFMIIFILPLDVSSTFYKQCVEEKRRSLPISTDSPSNLTTTTASNGTTTTPVTLSSSAHTHIGLRSLPEDHCIAPVSHVPDYVLPTLWKIVYWTSQFLTWLLLPMMQSYSRAGDFTVMGKLRTAVVQNLIYYGTYLLIFGICLIYVAARPDLHIDAEKLKVIGVTASNTWGLFLLVLLLGYGLVEVPRYVWNQSKHSYTLSRTYFKLAKQSVEKTEAEEQLEDVLEEVKQASEKIRYNHSLRRHVETILEKCPETVRNSVSRTEDYEDYNKSIDTPSEKSLAKLHGSVIYSMQTNKRHQTQWSMMMQKAFDLEDLILNEVSMDRRYKHSFAVQRNAVLQKFFTPTVEWYWRCLCAPWVCRVMAVVLTIFSFMVVWSECLFFIKEPVLSLFALFINLAKENYDYVYIELASIITIAYICTCAYYSVFQIKILNYYYIAPHHQTNEYSLIFTGMLLCRLTPPMCLNFLGLIHLDSHVTHSENIQETAYTLIMGHMDVIPIISDGFNIYFPILVVLLCICTYFSLGSRVLHFLGINQFIGDDDLTQELVDEGKELVKRERRRLDRKMDSDARRREWVSRFGDSTSSTRSTRFDASEDVKIQPSVASQGSYTTPRNISTHDKSGLINEEEPMDFTDLPSSASHVGGYQSAAQHPRTHAPRPSSRVPPRGIFDDV